MVSKKLEYQINDKILSIDDFDWIINRIDSIYVRNSGMTTKDAYAIFIQQGSEIVELYLRTQDELIIAREFDKLCADLKKVNPMFDNSVEHFVLINYANLKDVTFIEQLQPVINLSFENYNLTLRGNAKKYDKIIDKFNEVNSVNEI